MLDYVALGILIFAFITVFYGIIVIHDIPYEIAVHRNHPHQDSIHVAGWISLLFMGAIWPFLWIWSTLYREDRGWGFERGDEDIAAANDPGATESEAAVDDSVPAASEAEAVSPEAFALVQHKLDALDDRIGRIEQAILAATEEKKNDGEAD